MTSTAQFADMRSRGTRGGGLRCSIGGRIASESYMTRPSLLEEAAPNSNERSRPVERDPPSADR